jgi:hypothetical protein
MKEYKSTRRGKPVKSSRWGWTGFHWYGRDDQGVSIWNGDKRTLQWCSWLMGGLGILLLLGPAAAMGIRPVGPVAIFGLVGALFLGIGWYMRRHFHWLGDLTTVDQVAADTGVEPENLDQLAKGRAIKPRVILNGVPVYNPADLGDVALLLRAAEPPADDLLLRPAQSARTDSSTLLHPSRATAEADQVIVVEEPAEQPLNLR